MKTHLAKLLATVVLAASPALAADDCVATGDQNSCSRVVACLGDGQLFDGMALGWDTGTVVGKIDGSNPCAGIWDSTVTPKRASISCQDGTTADVFYFNLDPATGTALALGQTNTGAKVTAWTGQNVLQYFSDQGFEPGTVQCGGVDVPIS